MIGDDVTNALFSEPTPRSDATVERYAARPTKRMYKYVVLALVCIIVGWGQTIRSDVADASDAIEVSAWAAGMFLVPIALWMVWSTRRTARRLEELVRDGVAYRAGVIRDYHALGAHQVALAWHEDGRELAATFHITAAMPIGREVVVLSSPRWRKVAALIGNEGLALARKSRRLGHGRHEGMQ